jgi:hypothetical protein
LPEGAGDVSFQVVLRISTVPESYGVLWAKTEASFVSSMDAA